MTQHPVPGNSLTTEESEAVVRGLSPPAFRKSCAIIPTAEWFECRDTADGGSCATVCWASSLLPLSWNASLGNHLNAWNRGSSSLSCTTMDAASGKNLTSDSTNPPTSVASSCEIIEVSKAVEALCLQEVPAIEACNVAQCPRNFSLRSQTVPTPCGEQPCSGRSCGCCSGVPLVSL